MLVLAGAALVASAADAAPPRAKAKKALPAATTRPAGPPRPAWAAVLQPLVGKPIETKTWPDDTILDVAYRFRLGYLNVQRANPSIDVWVPDPGTPIRLPTQSILPQAEPRGVVINVPEMRLYDFTPKGGLEVFAVAVGDVDDPSPVGQHKIGRKRTNPTWYVPASIRLEKPELPAEVPPGPENPLGTRFINVSNTSYGIHGTNNPWSIGREATHGCMRLYEDEMERLYERVETGTPLTIVYQTVKLGAQSHRLYLEAHPDLYGREKDRNVVADTLARLEGVGLASYVDRERLEQALALRSGLPEAIGVLPFTEGEPTLRPERSPERRSAAPALVDAGFVGTGLVGEGTEPSLPVRPGT